MVNLQDASCYYFWNAMQYPTQVTHYEWNERDTTYYVKAESLIRISGSKNQEIRLLALFRQLIQCWLTCFWDKGLESQMKGFSFNCAAQCNWSTIFYSANFDQNLTIYGLSKYVLLNIRPDKKLKILYVHHLISK